MRIDHVVIVAFKEFDNLGVGYLSSVLSENGYDPLIIDFLDGKKKILQTIKRLNPLIIGFSVIFQYYIYEFKELISYLRKSGITSHFSAGGQYASMRFDDLFMFIPSLDSIVRFEGEYTFLELVNQIHTGKDWRHIKGIVFRENCKIIANPLRPPEIDLDKFPFPTRSPLANYVLEKKFATLIAGRGCVHNCSFCNNTEYIRQSSVPFRRTRNPVKVAEEMDFLHQTQDCSVFLFEDDDFPVKAKNGYDWIDQFCKELKHKNLANKIIWKINCRTDEVDQDRFAIMKSHGLYLVFLGIDDGTDRGLSGLNKHITAADNMSGIDILKRLEIGFDYGFMLFQPASDFKSINDNLNFLRKLCDDGSTPVTFLKLEPFFDTRIEKELRTEGRLRGKPGLLYYNFLNSSMDLYYEFIKDIFMEWIGHPDGLVNISKWARNYLSVFSHFYEMTPEVLFISSKVRKLTSQSNIFILDVMEELACKFETGNYDNIRSGELAIYRANVENKHDMFKEQIVSLIKEVGHIAEYQRIVQLVRH